MAIDYAQYVKDNPDLVANKPAGMSDEEFGNMHWNQMGGRDEGRANTPETAAGGERLTEQDFQNYALSNPDLRENVEAAGLLADEVGDYGRWHYYTHGLGSGETTAQALEAGLLGEGRLNRPGDIGYQGGYTEELGAQHYTDPVYEGKSVEEILGESVRSADPSALWQIRAGLGTEETPWDLSTFNPEGWNMAADVPYRLGVEGDNVYIRNPYGQLGVTGDPRFLQDRYVEAAIANDFPAEWVGEGGAWEGPPDMAPYWNQLTNAVRNEQGWLRAAQGLPEGSDAIIPNVPIGSYGGYGGAGPGVAGMLSTVPYTQPAPQDWSNIMPVSTPLASQQALVSGQGKFYQPWATGQGVPPGLLNYQIPGGPAANLTYSGAQPSLFDPITAATNGTTETGTEGTKYTDQFGQEWPSYHDWYTNSASNPLVVGNEAAAMGRLYQAAGGDPVWGDVTFGGRTGQDAWFYGPRGETPGYSGGLSYADIVGK
jgi:hypothetical protein